jgi:hypothetical protein
MEQRGAWKDIDDYLRSGRVEGLMSFISYAQNYEDIILWHALRDIEHGFCVDTGAAEPEEYSVTKILEDCSPSVIDFLKIDVEGLLSARQARRSIGRRAGTD